MTRRSTSADTPSKVLLNLSGHAEKIRTSHPTDWSLVAQWKPESRYEAIGSVTKAAAQAVREYEKTAGGVMKSFEEKFQQIANEIVAEKGELSLFAIFFPKGDPTWEVIVRAPWATKDIAGAIGYIVEKLALLSRSEWKQFGRVVILERIPPIISAQAGDVDEAEPAVEIGPFTLMDIDVSRAIIFRLKRPPQRKMRTVPA